jgi:(p)ppGpp synthase/HD superfamily hydrolase
VSETVARARLFADAAHSAVGQSYAGGPYVCHLDHVAGLLVPWGELAQVVGYLHDVVEDTKITLDIVRAHFGDQASYYVSIITDCPGINRKERKLLTNRKLAAVLPADDLALLVKVADRLSNVRQSARDDAGSKLEMYQAEHDDFRKAAYRPGLCDGWWAEINWLVGKR